MRLRLLPVLILVASLAMTAKLGTLWFDSRAMAQADGSEAEAASETAAGAMTTAADEASSGPAEAAEEGTAASVDEPFEDGAEDTLAQDTAAEADGASPVPGFQKEPLSPDPFDLTDEEIDILQALAQRREELEARERDLKQREAMLAAAEARIEAKVRGMEELRAEIEALLQQHADKNEEQLLSLVRIYESMKPKDAARIFEELDMEVLLEVVDRMKERKSATILAQMNPRRAKAITLELARRDELPLPKE